jgi:hypothetical protein
MPSAALWLYKRRDESTPIIHCTHPAPISSSHTQNYLSIGAPPAASVEWRHVTIYAALSPSGVNGGNLDDLISFYETTMDREPDVLL